METTARAAKEKLLRGIPASSGIAVGPVYLFHKDVPIVQEKAIVVEEIEKEIGRLQQAVGRSQKELSKIYEFAKHKIGDHQAKIFEAQLMILEDVVLFDSIYQRLRTEKKNAEFIVYDEIGKYHRLMAASRDEYTRERALDVEDLRNRIVRNLQEQRLISRLEGSPIIVAHNLAAADALILSRNEILGYTTDMGGVTSHTALLARALKIPSVFGLGHISTLVHDGDLVVLDGYSGVVVLNPSEQTLEEYRKKKAEYREFEETLEALRDLPAETPDGRHVELSANVELEEELEFIKLQGAGGIGLYRSETLLIGGEIFPTEDEQYERYRIISEAVFPKGVIIRTFDIGGDKMMAHMMRENNPFLGWRGIRVMLDKPEIFLEQLRAILRASAKGNVSIMFPMVGSIKEVRKAKQLMEDAKGQLRSKGLPYDDKMKIGVMIEIPAAAVIAEDLAEEVDFFSIGTNDLIQYLLAVDRGNEIVSPLYQEFHPAVVRFLRRIIERGQEHNIRVGMCGEMAGDPLATILLLGLGLDEFSVVPYVLPEIKKIIRSVKYKDAKKIAKYALELQTEDEIKKYLRSVMKERFPDIPIE